MVDRSYLGLFTWSRNWPHIWDCCFIKMSRSGEYSKTWVIWVRRMDFHSFSWISQARGSNHKPDNQVQHLLRTVSRSRDFSWRAGADRTERKTCRCWTCALLKVWIHNPDTFNSIIFWNILSTSVPFLWNSKGFFVCADRAELFDSLLHVDMTRIDRDICIFS